MVLLIVSSVYVSCEDISTNSYASLSSKGRRFLISKIILNFILAGPLATMTPKSIKSQATQATIANSTYHLR